MHTRVSYSLTVHLKLQILGSYAGKHYTKQTHLKLVLIYQEEINVLLRAVLTGNIDDVRRELTGHTDVNSQDREEIHVTAQDPDRQVATQW